MKDTASSMWRSYCKLFALLSTTLLILSLFVVASNDDPETNLNVSFSRPNQKVDDGLANSRNSDIAVDENDIIHVVWSDDRTGYNGIYYSKSTDQGSSWSPSIRIDYGVVGENSRLPSIAIDKTGGIFDNRIYVAWQEAAPGSGVHIYATHSSNSGLTWAAPARVDSASQDVRCLEPDIAIDSSGNVYVAWYDNRNPSYNHIFASKSTDGGSSFEPEVQISTQDAVNAFPSVTTVDDRIYVSWKEQDLSSFMTLWIADSADFGTSWTPHVLFAGPSGSVPKDLEVTADGSGVLHAVWAYQNPSNEKQISYSKSTDDGITWSRSVRVDDYFSSTSYSDPSILSGPRGLYVTWSDNRAGDPDIFFSYSEDGGLTWGDGIINNNDVRVDDTDENADPFDDSSSQMYPSIALGIFGVFVVWDDYRSGSSYDVYFSSYMTGQIFMTELRDAPDDAELVEVYNFGLQPVDMNGYVLQIDDTQIYSLAAIGIIPPLGYRTLGDDASADLVLPLDLVDEGARLLLFDPSATLIDEVAYGQKGTAPDPLPEESIARHMTGLGYTDEWVREQVPTFGADNNVPGIDRNPDVVLNEILFNPNVANDAFVEVFYKGSSPIYLLGYRIVCNQEFVVGAITLTESNPYYVLRYQMDNGFFDSTSSQQDNVYLYDSTGQLLDMSGWSSSHSQGFSMTRVPDGNGTSDGYNDITSERAGWAFDMSPTLPLVIVSPDYTASGDVGDRILFNLTVTNKQLVPDYVDITVESAPNDWVIEILRFDGIFPLLDSPGDGDGIPDSGFLSPEESFSFKIGINVPSDPPIGSSQTVKVIGTASSTSLASDSASILLKVYPHIEPFKNVAPSTIYHEDAGPGYPTVATVRLSVRGNGSAIVRSIPQDVIFLIDKSGSMGYYQKFEYAKLGAKSYVDDMKLPDQGAVIFFDEFVTLRNPLSTNYEQIKADIDSVVATGGWTAIGTAINAGWNSLVADGDPTHLWVCILLTDGRSNTGLDPIAEAQNAAANNVVIYTIGLAPDADNVTLQNIAAITGGKYFYAESPEGLVGIYQEIGTIVDHVAGRDLDVSDHTPMIEDVIPSYIHLVVGSFRDPSTGLPKIPDYMGNRGIFTFMQWNVSSLSINETWEVEYDITSDLVGTVPVGIYPDARVAYVKWDGNETVVPFPEVFITVTYYASPPKNVETFWGGPDQIGLRWVEVPWPELDHYLIYRAQAQNGFQDLSPAAAYDVVPAGTTEWIDPEVGGAASHDGEHYYLIRAANANESEVSETSNTAGAWTKTFSAGFNTFSVPLDYFPWVEYDGAGKTDTVQEYVTALGADYIEYMESEHWLRVPGAGDPLKRIEVGEGCLMNLGSSKRFTFVGLPGSMIRYDELPFAGFDYTSNAKSVELSIVGNGIRITWQQPLGADTYDIYYSSSRVGFYGELGIDYWLLFDSLNPPAGPTASVDHGNALFEPYEEFYYMIFPMSNSLGLGSGSYSSGIWLGRFSEGYHAISLPLKPFSNGQYFYYNVSFYADHIVNTLVILWFKDSESRWIPHIPAMEEGTYDTRFTMFVTLKLNVLSDVIFGFAGV
ncbi:MAG: VWA domain-containing protein [Thermoplasmata archaeon]